MLCDISMATPWQARLTITLIYGLENILTYCLLYLLLGATCIEHDSNEAGFLMCRKCGYEIARAQDFISIPSSLALRQRNDSISNNKHVLIQLFKNPQDMYFEVITCSEAEIEKSVEKYAADSWFPGYTWSIAKCPRCGSHVGWSFQAIAHVAMDSAASSVKSFVGLIMDKIMHEEDVNNLIAVPKVYAS